MSGSASSSSTDPAAPGPGLLEVGRITKPHGLQGDLVVVLTTDRRDRLDPGSTLHTERGRLTVERSRTHADRFVVTFAEVDGRDEAEQWRNLRLWAEPVEARPGEHFVHELIGLEVVEADGTRRGAVVEVLDNPAADLLVLDSGALVPMSFVTSVGDHVEIDPPPGLFDLG